MAGLDTLPDATRIAMLVRDVTGEEPRGVRPLGAGESSMAWRVETETRPLVVLHEKPAVEWPPHLAMQIAILGALEGAGEIATPRPVASSVDPEFEDAATFDLEWAIVSEAAGAPIGERPLTPDAARGLGATLARLHGVEVGGFGRLENRLDALEGAAGDMASGLLSRWPGLWPFDGRPLIAMPVARVAPRLIASMAPIEPALQRFGALTSGVLLHGDLNPAHVWVDEDEAFTSLIDFGDAFVGPPAADIATFAYFSGWDCARWLLEGYTEEPMLRELRLDEARLFSVAYALHRINRGAQQGDDRHLQRSLDFLDATLPSLGHLTKEI
ncbi:MAG: aminoglycoside phosphotransferase family protein [Dehalococcoidia bacterium]